MSFDCMEGTVRDDSVRGERVGRNWFARWLRLIHTRERRLLYLPGPESGRALRWKHDWTPVLATVAFYPPC
ncbi:unnamed protein product [Danaus chrysippus]|uniref:(African queen) hypothetical protein n=1 Tax=Danaus chrysippus TaxID=151541 RepID=A0A8J2QUY8_9NEOP|nr:unnamed protein product [Danaus chrysippus]